MVRAVALGGAGLVLLAFCGNALAFDDSALPQGRDEACSALCRSWLGLARAPAPLAAESQQIVRLPEPQAAASAEPAPVAPASAGRAIRAAARASRAGRSPAMRAAGIGIALRTASPVRRDGTPSTAPAPAHLVPTPPRLAGLVGADAPPSPQRDSAPPPVVEPAKAPVPDIAVLPAVAPPRTPDAPSPVVTASVDTVTPERDPSADLSGGAPTPAAASTAAAPGPAAADIADRSAVAPIVRLGGESTGTPLGVKLGFYGILALITAFALRRPQPTRRPERPTAPAARAEPSLRTHERAVGMSPRARSVQPVMPIRNGAARYAMAAK